MRIIAAALLISSGVVNAQNSDLGTSVEFQIQRQPGALSLVGHTSSPGHAQALTSTAGTYWPDTRIVTDFQTPGTVPAYWVESTVLALDLLRHANSAELVLSASEARIRAVIVDEPAWRSRFGAFERALPDDVPVTADTIVVDPTVNVSGICRQAFDSFDTGPVNFEESSIELRSSAYPRLARLMALAETCSDSRIEITGHTDASGEEGWNQALSILRANAVGDYLVKGGIARDRLEISGVGSAEPIADNNNRYGRRLNRPIEIALIPVN